ncbi:hypothetical protein [Halobacteriovorax sp.]|uniref:hypothetical protein n=1 Tax=Halobacteriovorax sp. TaxID=2020862 RepID=UPI0035642D56
MKLTISILAICLLTFSCKKEEKDDKKSSDERFIFGKEIAKERALETGEFAVAKEMCQSLQNKREYFEERGDRELSFIFSLSDKSCNTDDYSSANDYSVNLRVPRVGDLTFDGPRGTSFTEDILTDVHPHVESICSNVLKDINITNVQTVGSIKYQYRFLRATNGYIFEVGKFAQNNSNVYIPTFIESFSIYSSAAALREGMVGNRIRVTSCSNGQAQSSRQILK